MDFLPNYTSATLEISKLRDYILNEEHPIGKHKARLFKSILGISKKDAPWLKEQILLNLSEFTCEMGGADFFGIRYIVKMKLVNFAKGCEIVTVWIIRKGVFNPEFVTCYPLKTK